MQAQISYRPSRAPGFAKCPSYVETPEVEVVTTIPAAGVGNAIHEVFEKYIVPNKLYNDDVLKKLATKYNVEVDGYSGIKRKLFQLSEKWQDKAAKFFDSPKTEVFMKYTLSNGIVLQGTADLLQIHETFAVIGDLKTGESEQTDYIPQLKDYALLAMRKFASNPIQKFFLFVFNPVLDHYDVQAFTREEIEDHEKYIVNRMELVGRTFEPGSQCGWCPNLVTCKAHKAGVDAFLQEENKDVMYKLTPELIGQIRPDVQYLRKMIAIYDETEKALLEKEGVLNLGDGTELFFREEGRKTYNYQVVKNALISFRDGKIGDKDVEAVAKISKGVFEELITNTSEKGMKGKDKKEFQQILADTEGAFEESVIKKRATRKLSISSKGIPAVKEKPKEPENFKPVVTDDDPGEF